MRTKNFARLFAMMITSFVIVVIGYTFISHAFDLFLYPDQAFATRLYAAAGIDVLWFDAIVIIITLTIIVNWLRTYYRERKGHYLEKVYKPLWLAFYALLSREFYIIELYTSLVRRLDGLATRLNVWLRWV
jgi:NADH-quinone oxidoreductase subunit L